MLTSTFVSFKWRKPAYLAFLTAAELDEYKGQWKGKAVPAEHTVKQLPVLPKDRLIWIKNPHDFPVKTNFSFEGYFRLPEDMPGWIRQNLVYSND